MRPGESCPSLTQQLWVGTRIARVKVIFKLPPQFGPYAHPLAYVEWYTPLGRIEPVTRMHQIRRSTVNHLPNAEVISVTQIVRGCHLVAKTGKKIDRSWTSHRFEVFLITRGNSQSKGDADHKPLGPQSPQDTLLKKNK